MQSVTVPLMLPDDIQRSNEYAFYRKHVDRYIKEELSTSPEVVEKLNQGVEELTTWVNGSYYPKKQSRVNVVKGMDLHALALNIITTTAYITTPELFTSVTAKVASRLLFNDKADAILTIAEIMAVLASTDLYDIFKLESKDSLKVRNNIVFSDKLQQSIARSQYLPPLVCEPEPVKSNRQSGDLTHNQSVILQKENHHDDPVSLDVINLQNSTPLTINQEFLSVCKEEPTYELDSIQKQLDWGKYAEDSQHVYELLTFQTDVIYFDHAYDKRGRLYPRGYHVSYMSTPYKKAMLDFAEQEPVDVPEKYRLYE